MQVPQSKAFIIQLPLIYPNKQTLIKLFFFQIIYYHFPLVVTFNKRT